LYTGSRLVPNSMTLDDLERQNKGFCGFFGDFGLRPKSIIHKVEPRNYHYVHLGMTVIKVLYFIPNSRKSNSNSDRKFRCTIFLYCERNNLLFSKFLMHSIWWNSLHTLQCNLWYFVRWCCHLGNRFTTHSTNQRWLIALIDLLYFNAWKQLLLPSCLSHRNSIRPSVRPSHGWISQKRCKLGLPNFHRQLHGTIIMRFR